MSYAGTENQAVVLEVMVLTLHVIAGTENQAVVMGVMVLTLTHVISRYRNLATRSLSQESLSIYSFNKLFLSNRLTHTTGDKVI